MSGEPMLLTIPEVAALLQMSVTWVKRSDLPRLHLGRSVRFRRCDIEQYATARLSHRLAA